MQNLITPGAALFILCSTAVYAGVGCYLMGKINKQRTDQREAMEYIETAISKQTQ